ncbi:MAG: hypothetical protein WD512_10810 [Candidatus Paceibacterota bacterium]
MDKIKQIFIAVLCTAFSLTLFMLPNVQGAENPTPIVISEDSPCGDQGVKEIIYGENKFLGCWGSNETCKIKCFEPQVE